MVGDLCGLSTRLQQRRLLSGSVQLSLQRQARFDLSRIGQLLCVQCGPCAFRPKKHARSCQPTNQKLKMGTLVALWLKSL